MLKTRSLPSSLRSKFAVMISCLALLAGMASMPAYGQSAAGTIPTGTNPQGVAVNPVTDTTFVTNYNSNTVTVIFGSYVGYITLNVGTNPDGVAVNTVTNKIYVTNSGAGTVSVIDGSSFLVTNTVTVGTNPQAVAVDPVTNKIYVANYNDGTVTVIDGASDTASSPVLVGKNPTAVAVNPVTDKIFVANSHGNSVSVIDGSTNTVSSTVPVGTLPQALAVNPVTDKVYVTNTNSNSVSVIDGATDAVSTTVPVGTNPTAVAVNSLTNQVYVSNNGAGTGNTVSVIDGSTDAVSTTVTVGAGPQALAVNPVTDNVFVANDGTSTAVGNTVSVIDGSKNTVAATLNTSSTNPFSPSIAVNPVTDKIYVGNFNDASVKVIDGPTNTVTKTIPVDSNMFSLVLNPATDKIYVFTFNQVTNTDELMVIDGATDTVTGTIPLNIQRAVSGSIVMAVNPVTNKVYVPGILNGNNSTANVVAVIDGATGTETKTIPVGSTPEFVALDPGLDKIYVPNNQDNTVSVIDGATDTVTQTVTVGTFPQALAVDPMTHKVYVANSGDNTVSVIFGVGDSVLGPAGTVLPPIKLGGYYPDAVAVNPVTDKVYVANAGSSSAPASVSVISGTTVLKTLNAGSTYNFNYINGLAVNPVTNKVYVANNVDGTVSVIDGTTDTVSSTLTPVTGAANQLGPDNLAVNPVTGKVYVQTDYLNGPLAVIDSEGLQTVPITMTAAGVTDSLTTSAANAPVFQSMNTQPTFTVTATSAFSSSSTYSSLTPTDPPPTALYYAVDGGDISVHINNVVWTETPATSAAGSNPAIFTIAPGTLSPGFHTLYYYTAYGNEGGQNSFGNSSGLGSGNSPEISNIKAIHFLVETMSTTTSVAADVNPQNAGSQVTFTATIAPNPSSKLSSALSGTVQFYDGATLLGSATVQDSGGVYQATYSTTTLAAGSHTINAVYSGDTNYAASSGQMTEKIAGTATAVSLASGGGQSAPIGTAFTNPVVATVVDSNGIAVPGATVNFSGTGLSYSPATVSTDSSGQASTTATPTQGGTLTGKATVSGTSLSTTFSETGTQLTPTVTVSSATTVYSTATTQLSATVSYAGTTAPTGAVSFTAGTGSAVTASCSATNSTTLTCTASYPTATLAVSGSPYTITATLAADTNYATASGTGTLTVTKATPVITWPTPAAITYGTALSATQLNATAGYNSSAVAGTFAYTPVAGTVLSPGTYTLSATFTPTDTTDYTTATGSVSLTVTKPTLTLTANNTTKVYGAANPTFTGTITGAVNGDTFTESFSTTATTTSTAGTYPITPSVTGTNLSDYTVATTNGTLTVTKAGSAVALTTSTSNANLNANVTFTATVTSATSGTPTGSVQFLDGSTVLGSGQVNNNGVATYSIGTLPAGLHQITAVYQGDVDFQQSTSAALAQTVTAPDFGLMSSNTNLTLKAGQTGKVTISMVPVGGFKGDVQFTCSGLPTLAQCSFSPSSLTADGSNSTQTSTLTITTKGSATGTVSMMTHPNKPDGTMLAGIFWLPAFFFGGFLFWQRKKLTQKYRVLLILLVAAATISGAVGCGSSMPHTAPGTSTVTVTGTSGSSTQTVTVYVDVTK